MRVLVTGGLGFQGFHLSRTLLDKGHEVTILTSPSARNFGRLTVLTEYMAVNALPPGRLRVVSGSITDAEVLEKAMPGHQALVHMAAWASVDASLDRPWGAYEVNTLGTLAVLEAARRFGDGGMRIVVASSCEVYGTADDQVFQAETSPMNPRSPYAASKAAADRLAFAHAASYGMPITILRPSNIFGPLQSIGPHGAVIAILTRKALRGESITVTGDGRQTREYLDVKDLVRAYISVLDAPEAPAPGEAFNVGSGSVVSILEIAVAIRSMVAPELPIIHTPARVADVRGFLLDSSKFRKRFNWRPEVEFKDGLKDFIAWAREAPEMRG